MIKPYQEALLRIPTVSGWSGRSRVCVWRHSTVQTEEEVSTGLWQEEERHQQHQERLTLGAAGPQHWQTYQVIHSQYCPNPSLKSESKVQRTWTWSDSILPFHIRLY